MRKKRAKQLKKMATKFSIDNNVNAKRAYKLLKRMYKEKEI